MTFSTCHYSVFICYAPTDSEQAERVRESLEDCGLRCWLAPRGHDPEIDENEQVAQALSASRGVVLLLSEASNHSKMIYREAEAAFRQGKPLYLVRLEDIQPSQTLEKLVSSAPRVDVWGSQAAEQLRGLCQQMAAGQVAGASVCVPALSSSPVCSDRRRWGKARALVLIVVLVILAMSGIGAGVYINGLEQADTPEAALVVPEAPTPPHIDSYEDPELLLIKLLAAIDAEDRAAVRSYAHALFKDRKDMDITEYVGRLRGPVLAAAGEGDVDLMRALASARPVFGMEDPRGREPIHVAAASGHADIVAFLIEEIHVSPDDLTDGTAYTAMHWAARGGHASVITQLAEFQADPNAMSNVGNSPLHLAVEYQQLVAIRVMLQLEGLDVNAINAKGQTPLHIAAAKGQAIVVTQLLAAGANLSIQDIEGRTPGDMAYAAAHFDLALRLGVSGNP